MEVNTQLTGVGSNRAVREGVDRNGRMVGKAEGVYRFWQEVKRPRASRITSAQNQASKPA